MYQSHGTYLLRYIDTDMLISNENRKHCVQCHIIYVRILTVPSVNLITQCSALMLLRKDILGNFTLSLDTLSDIHWLLLLRFAKEVLSTLRSVGDAHWARAVASALGVCLAGICPTGKVG